jgi:O-antigen ligase
MKLSINKTALEANLANTIFLLLFPGFFFYSYAVATGYIPAFPGGWFGIISVLSFMALFPLALLRFLNSRGLILEFLILFFLLLGLIAAWAGIHFLLGTPVQKNTVAFEGALKILVSWFIFFFAGYLISPRKWFLIALCGCLLGMVFLVVINFDSSRMMFYAKEQLSVKEGVAKYQGFARSFAVTAVLLLGFSRRIYSQAALIVISFVILYLLGARSEFYGFVFVVFAAGMVAMTRSSFLVKMLFFSIVAAFLILFLLVQGTEYSNRQLEVLKLADSSSVARRIELFQEGWLHVKNSPILGDYAGQLREGGFGSYIHNGLSAWRQFGMVGFILYFGLAMIFLFMAIRKVFIVGKSDPYWQVALYMNFYTLILLVAAKSIFGNIAPLAWGLTMGAFVQERGQCLLLISPPHFSNLFKLG